MLKIDKHTYFAKKVNDFHHQVIIEKVKINPLMCKTLIDLISGDIYKDFIEGNSNSSSMIIDTTHIKLLSCLIGIENNKQNNVLVITLHKLTGSTEYNENVIKELNTDFDFLLEALQIDKNVISHLNDVQSNGQIYIKLLQFVERQDVVRIFKILPLSAQSYQVCQTAINRDYNVIKHISDQLEGLVEMAIIKGHTNLADINYRYHTLNICQQYVDADIKNLQHISFQSKLPDSFFFNYIKLNPKNVAYINPSCLTPEMNTYMVSKDGTLIRYILPKFQSVRLIQLACQQNHSAKYYVTYDCPEKTDKYDLLKQVVFGIDEIKQLRDYSKLGPYVIKLTQLIESIKLIEPTDSNIVNLDVANIININIVTESHNFKSVMFYVMIPENYVNYQQKLHIERKYEPNFETLISGSNVTVQTKSNEAKTEYSATFKDSNDNTFVAVFECVSGILNKA